MKRSLLALFALVLFAAALAPAEAAGRLGGGRSLGAQRQIAPSQRQATPPAQQPHPGAPQPAGAGRWLAPLAGLAAGLGLGWLFAQGGAGPLLAALVLALGVGLVVVLLLRLLGGRGMVKTAPRAPMQYQAAGETFGATPPAHATRGGARDEPGPSIPAGFDVDGFLGNAKRQFLVLQDANDRGDAEALRDVTTAEMFDALADDVRAHAGAGQQLDVVSLDADLLEVVSEGRLHWASVRFHGTMREDPRALPAGFEEIWHLQKPVDGSSGWVLAGIQQTA